MNKIIGILRPFDVNQKFYVYKNSKEVDCVYLKMDEIPEQVLKLSKYYDINEIDLNGGELFTKQLVYEIQKQELSQYNRNSLIINII